LYHIGVDGTVDVGDRSRVDERDAAIGLEASLTTGVGQLNLVIRRVGKDLQWASYVEDLNGRRSGDYGTDPRDLSQIAKSPIRLNQSHFNTVFRVRMDGLKPETTYFYTVDSMEANGNDDG